MHKRKRGNKLTSIVWPVVEKNSVAEGIRTKNLKRCALDVVRLRVQSTDSRYSMPAKERKVKTGGHPYRKQRYNVGGAEIKFPCCVESLQDREISVGVTGELVG